MTRELHQIALEVSLIWSALPHRTVYAALPYLEAMKQMVGVNENYGHDSGRSVVLYFLSNCKGWRGEDARRIKAELRSMLR